MDETPVSETLPALYREVLDAVAALEQAGRRGDAALVRADATRAYSKAWTPAAARRLIELLQLAVRLRAGGREPSRTRFGRAAARVFALERAAG